VLGAVEVSHEVGARSICITCNPGSPLAEMCEIAIVPEVGPEVIAGSTRMKGGLVQKMVLHLMSTATMVKLGRTHGNLMSNLAPNNRKLKERAREAGILIEAGDVCFLQERPPQNFIRLGYSSISAKKIEPGIQKLAALIHDMI